MLFTFFYASLLYSNSDSNADYNSHTYAALLTAVTNMKIYLLLIY